MLWFIISGGLFVSVACVWVLTEGVGRARLGRLGDDLFMLSAACAALGFLAHAVLVMCGVRLTGRPAPAEAADYDDAPSARPPDGPENEPPTLTPLR